MEIRKVLQRRTDLSTFLVHLTRDDQDEVAKERLKSILVPGIIQAKSMMGHAVDALERKGMVSDSQRCVCFTETPLEYVNLLVEEIDGRKCQFRPYGVAITKRQGRDKGVNPIWYVDITPRAGSDWLSKSINRLVDSAIDSGNFDSSDIANLAPFIEPMGKSKPGARKSFKKEFWWEREWRHIGDFVLPPRVIILVPEGEIDEFKEFLVAQGSLLQNSCFVDPSWSLEEIIARLAGYGADEVNVI